MSTADPFSNDSQFTVAGTFKTELSILGVSVLPAIGHRGSALICVAHGADGVAVYDLGGELIWSDIVPAHLAVFSQGRLLVYTKSEDADRVTVYDRMDDGSFTVAEVRSPPIPTATTLQRTALADIGPARIMGDEIEFAHHGRLKAQTGVTAVAGAKNVIPVTAGLTAIYGDTSGAVHIVEIHPSSAEP